MLLFQKTVFGGQPSKPDYKDIPCAVFWYGYISMVCFEIMLHIYKPLSSSPKTEDHVKNKNIDVIGNISYFLISRYFFSILLYF